MLNHPLKNLQNLIQCGYYKDIHFLRYEDLCSNPSNSLEKIYDYLNLDKYTHNFNKIDQVTKELDNFITFGDHKIKNHITPSTPDWEFILGTDISQDIYQKFEWFFNYLTIK
jgi:sulfotransferase